MLISKLKKNKLIQLFYYTFLDRLIRSLPEMFYEVESNFYYGLWFLKKSSKFKVSYLWYVKPGERNAIPIRFIKKNSRYSDPIFIDREGQFIDLVSRHQEVREIWDEIPHWVMRSDILRLLQVYEYGGFYFDCDFLLRRNIDGFLDGDKAVVFNEIILKSVEEIGLKYACRDEERKFRIANFAFGSTFPKNPFYREIIDETVARVRRFLKESTPDRLIQSDIIYLTGPDVITSIYHTQKNRHAISVVPQDYFYHACFNSWHAKEYFPSQANHKT